ncbi:MAG: ROK family protein [Chloroflexota bacterium]|nr:ROK family protein [Chloroflexota bacterium]
MPQRFIAAVDLGASNVRVAIASSDGGIEARRSAPYGGGTPEAVIDGIGRTIDDLVRGVWVGARVAAIGVCLPGSVDPASGTVSTAANLPGWGEVPIGRLLGGPRGVPVAMENDANAAAVGERWLGAARGLDDFIFIALGTGIGAGVVLDGKLHRGAHFLAGEVAFFPMTREHLHHPGWDHCLEADAGGRAYAAKAAALLGDAAKPGDLFDAAAAGDKRASAWLREVQDELAMAIVDIAALLDPQAIVFGGGVAMAQGERLLGPVREAALRCLPARPAIVLSELGADAQLLGAVRLALDRLAEQGR